jgi:hypothetical protein
MEALAKAVTAKTQKSTDCFQRITGIRPFVPDVRLVSVS